MKYPLKNYQQKSVKRMLNRFDNLLQSNENEICILKAPTGSGKTIICAEFLKQFVKINPSSEKFSYIWISVRQLHNQSKDKLESYYESDNSLKCSYWEDLVDKKIRENEILFINWESTNRLKKIKSLIHRDNEKNNNLKTVLKNTKNEGRQIILIIDESHHTAHAENSQTVISMISPKITLEVSATPNLQDRASEIEKISVAEVKEEEMMKREIAINKEFGKIKVDSKSGTDLVLEEALKKRKELKKMLEKEGSNVNPLMLIQLPDKKNQQEQKAEEVKKLLKEKYDVSEEKGNMAIWLSEKHSSTIKNIEKQDNDVEVLLFKQAIALGWDCPRAYVLVIFRESNNINFSIQVIGRIMRVPEPELGYYQEDELNKGFVFTNLESIITNEEYAKEIITIFESKRRNELYKDIHLKSIHWKRQREKTRLSGEFIKIFSEVASKEKLEKKITLKPKKIMNPIIKDGIIKDPDKTGVVEKGGTVNVSISELEINFKFNEFVRNMCSSFEPSRSSDIIKTALYRFFENKYKLQKHDPEIQKIVLGEENNQVIIDTINLSLDAYNAKIVQQLAGNKEKITNDDWEVPSFVSFNNENEKKAMSLSIMEPFYIKKEWKPEIHFMEYLSNSKKVNWWFKNGELEPKYFSVTYVDEFGIDRNFYVDFIISFKDGKIGLFDTKQGNTAKDAGPRSNGLQKYIRDENKRGKKIIGGIIIEDNGSWRYYDKPKYEYIPNDYSKWNILEL